MAVRDAQLRGERRGVHRARAAVREQRRSRAGRGLSPSRPRAARASSSRSRARGSRAPPRASGPSGSASAATAAVGQLLETVEIARGERAGGDVAEHDVRVGDRRLLAAEAVAGGPGTAPALRGPTWRPPAASSHATAAAARADLGDVDASGCGSARRCRAAVGSRPRAKRRPRTPGCARRGRPRSARPSPSSRPCRRRSRSRSRALARARAPRRRPAAGPDSSA